MELAQTVVWFITCKLNSTHPRPVLFKTTIDCPTLPTAWYIAACKQYQENACNKLY